MKLSWYSKCIGTLLIVTVYCYSVNGLATNSGVSRRPPTNALNLTVPLGKIQAKLNALLTKGLNLELLLNTLLEALQCLSPSPGGEKGVFVLPDDLKQDLEMKIQMQLMDYSTLLSKENITEYCNSEDFKIIHNFLWKDDDQFLDLLKFFHKFGYPGIYMGFQALYGYFECYGLGDIPSIPIPTGPTAFKIQATPFKPTHVREQVLSSMSSGYSLQQPFQAKCNLTEILTNLIKAGTLELLQLVDTIVEVVATDPSLHFLIGKIAEPIKGVSFREFRLLTPMRKLFVAIHKALIEIPIIEAILDLVQTTIGLDLKNVNLIETVLNILEALLWQNFDVVPPFVPGPDTYYWSYKN